MPKWTGRQNGRGARLYRTVARLFGLDLADAPLRPGLSAALRLSETAAQAAAIARERPMRLAVIALQSAVFLLYLPWYVVLPPALTALLADRLEVLWHERYERATLATVFLGELGFCLPAAIVWHSADPFAKAIAIAVLSAAMMRLATVRSIRPATGLAGLAALGSLIAVSNSTYWIRAGNGAGLALTTLIAVVALGYVAAAILQNHGQQRQAAISNDAALRASAAKSRFLAQMSHELRTPLNAIIGTGTAALLQSGEGPVKAQLAVLLKSAEGLALVLNDVLDLAAVEEGHVTLRPRIADVAEEVCQTVALFRPGAEAAGLDLRLQVDGTIPRALLLDFDRLRQCLSNLLSNALKHTGQGQIIVHLRYEAPGQLVLQVADSGPGVPAGEEERIFQRYGRNPTGQAGHGLGLSICRVLLDRMGGQILLLPSIGGARFEIRVPAAVATLPVAAIVGQGGQDLSGPRVLIVDDIATNRLVAATYLGLLHCKVVEAASGTAALAMLHGVDLVLLDMNMPGLSGLETLARIRALDGPAARLPVVAMTADAQDHDRQTYLAAGLNGYVTKPMHLDALRAELARVLAAC